MTLPVEWPIATGLEADPLTGRIPALKSIEEMYSSLQKEIASYSDQGDLVVGIGNGMTGTLPGGNDGEFLSRDSNEETGMKWSVVDLTPYVTKDTLHANTILYATTDHTPTELSVAASRIVGRKSTGDIIALTAAELWAILGDKATTEVACITNNQQLTTAQCYGTILSNYDQADANVAILLPTAGPGMNMICVCGTTRAGKTWKFTAAANDKHYLDGVAGTDGQSVIVTPAVGNYITLVTFQTGASSWDWLSRTGMGTWTAGA